LPSRKPDSDKGLGRIAGLLLTAAVAVGLLFLPDFLNLYWLRIVSNIFMFAALAQGINIIAGYTGYPAFGNVVFFGLGAYSTAIVMVKFQGSFITGVLVGGAVCLVFVLLLGPYLLRLWGHYFAIATLGMNEAIKAIIYNATDFTGGGMGLSVPLPPGNPAESARYFYYLLYGAMVLSVLVTYWLSVSRLGHACRAIRDDEVKAKAMGLPTERSKLAAWAISAVLTGFVGGIYAYWFSYIEPPVIFDMTIAVESFVIFLLGGAGTVLGPVIGAAIVELFATLTWSHALNYHVGILGLIIIVIVVALPKGFIVFVRDNLSVAALLRRLAQSRARPDSD